MKALLGFILLFIAPQILAGPFDPPPTDKSLEILGGMLGGTVGDIYLGGGANPILYRLIEKFNYIIIAAGALIVSYVTVQSITHTAHEGEMLGGRKTKWSAVWIPIRSIIGMSLLVPTPATGYCLIQVAVVWIVVQGVGIADIMWKITMDGLSSGVSASAGTMTDNTLVPIGERIGQELLNASVCMQTVMALADPNGNSYVYRNANSIRNFTEQKTFGTTNPKPYEYGVSTAGVPYASVSGTSYFGFDNAALPQDAKRVCGSIDINVTVSLDEYSKDVQDAFLGPEASQSAEDLEKLLFDAAQLIYETKLNAFSAMLQKIQPIAKGMVDGTYGSLIMPGSLLPTPPPGLKNTLGNIYAQYMSTPVVPEFGSFTVLSGVTPISEIDSITEATTAAETLVSNVSKISSATITDFRKSTMDAITGGVNAGWIAAGSYYFVLNKTLIGTQFKSALDPFNDTEYNIPSCSDPNSACYKAITRYNTGIAENATTLNSNLDPGEDQALLAMNLANDYLYYSKDLGLTSSKLNLGSADGEGGGEIVNIMNEVNNASTQIFNVVSGIFAGNLQNMDPLLAHAKFGRIIMSICETVWIAVVKKPMGKIANLFGGESKSLLWGSIFTAFFMLMWILLPVIGFLWGFGALLAIYCPLIPFMFFTLGALGWYIIVIEAVIGAPIIAIGLITPGGEDLGNTARAGMILANIFFRPVLMIFGFLLAGRVYKAIIQLIDFGMGSIFMTLDVTTLFSIVVIVALYVSFILSATNICFSLIYELPNKILRWLGGETEHIELAEIGDVKGVTQEAGQEVGSFLQETSKKGLADRLKKIANNVQKGLRGGGRGGSSS